VYAPVAEEAHHLLLLVILEILEQDSHSLGVIEFPAAKILANVCIAIF
jgi:hypothetical protein